MSADGVHVELRKKTAEPVYVPLVLAEGAQARTTAHEVGNYQRWLRRLNGLLTAAGWPMLGAEQFNERARA